MARGRKEQAEPLRAIGSPLDPHQHIRFFEGPGILIGGANSGVKKAATQARPELSQVVKIARGRDGHSDICVG